tara:strand:+ start:4431 stop:4925 length:495 start_codon:yes stop_codon:yes gene_type:complete
MATYSSTTFTSTRSASSSRLDVDETRNTAGVVSSGKNLEGRFSDLNLQMIPHPQKKDIIPLRGEEAVKNAIRNLILTSFFERPFQSNIGSNLRSLLFEPSDVITIQAIETGIQKVLELNEPRIENINVIVGVSKDERQYDINVIFSIMASEDIQEVQINLKRVR